MEAGRRRRRRRASAPLLLGGFLAALLVASGPAAAHPGDWLIDVIIRAELDAGRAAGPALTVTLENRTPSAVTLNGAVAPYGRPLRLERRLSVFGFEAWQPVRHLQVSPGRAARLGPPEYRWLAAREAMADLAKPGAALTAFLSPTGRVVVRIEPPGGETFGGDLPSAPPRP